MESMLILSDFLGVGELQAERQTQYTIAEGGDGRWYSGTVSRRDESECLHRFTRSVR